jgi:pSer/pThr/pTyr-binding forkhead associated (FHA) protein
LDPHHASPADLKERLAAERVGGAFVVYCDGDEKQQILRLSDVTGAVTIGRSAGTGICIDWDEEVSRVHAALERVGDHWTVVDDGLSSNGSFVNGVRIAGRRRLDDGDEIQVGASILVFRLPTAAPAATTRISDQGSVAASVSPAQRRVLVALCRPCKGRGTFAVPATNKQIAEELYLSVPAVKTHLRALATKLDINDLPQNRKRQRLVELAFQTGLVTEHDL